jgi:hypothetical protein
MRRRTLTAPTLLHHVLGASGRHLIWICEVLELPEPGIRLPPQPEDLLRHAAAYLEHVLEKRRTPLQDVGDARS